MKILITANSHPDYDRVGTLQAKAPDWMTEGNKALYAIIYNDGKWGTALEGQFKAIDSGNPVSE